jgi:hypothetical protein
VGARVNGLPDGGDEFVARINAWLEEDGFDFEQLVLSMSFCV